MLSTDRGSPVAPLSEVVDAVSPVIPPAAAPSLEKCAACGTILRPSRSPQLLPCLHSVCKVCVPPPVGVEESKRECPNCKRSYNTLEVTDNPLLKDSTNGPGTHRLAKCAGCEDTAISGWCVECGEALCSICVSAHQRVRVTREHTVLPQKLPPGFIPTLYCPTHREEPMKLFCVSCNQLTCRDCQLTYHRNHGYQFLNEAVTAQREQIESLMVRVRQQRAVVKQTLLDLDGRLQDLQDMKSKAKSKLQKMLIYIRCALLKRTAELFKNVQDLCGCEAQKITERQNDLRTMDERQEYILSFTERALQMENHSALLSCKKQIQSQLQDLLSQSAFPPASMIDVRLQFDQQSCCQIATVGKIVSNEVPFFRKRHDAVPKKSSLPPVQRQNVHPAPSSYQPYSTTLPAPSPSHSPLFSPQITPTSVCSLSVTSESTAASHAPLVSVSHQSSSASTLPSNSSITPPPPYSARAQTSAPSAPDSFPRAQGQPSRQRRNKQTWSFHPYQPKNDKLAGQQPNPCSAEPPQQLGRVSAPAPSPLPESQSPPVSVLPVVLSLLAPSILHTCPEQWNAHAVPNATAGSHTAPHGPWSEICSTELAELTGRVWPDKEEQQSKPLQCVLPIKAPADSPCERAPPAGCERTADWSPPATENEPTSTVKETDAALPQVEGAELPCAAGSPDSWRAGDTDATFTNGTSAPLCAEVPAALGHAGAVPEDPANTTAAHAPSVPTLDLVVTVGAPREPQPGHSSPTFSHSLQNQAEVRVQSCPQPDHPSTLSLLKDPHSLQLSNQDSSKPAEEPYFQPIKMQHEEGKASSSRNCDSKSAASQQAPPIRAGPIEIRVRQLQKCTARLPATLREILEANHSLEDSAVSEKHPILRQLLVGAPITLQYTPDAEAVATDQTDYRGSPVETEKTDDDEDGEDNFGTGLNSENEESGGPISRPCLPWVSVMRLPISVPPSGGPMPQFRLLPGTTEDEILLQMIEDDQFPDGQSAQATKKRLSDQSKAKLIVLRGPKANPTQPRKSRQRANHCPALQPEGSSRRPTQSTHNTVRLCCAACRVAGGLTVCVQCGRGFHRDCHIPPISSASSADWQCMLCRDLSDVGDLYSDERPRLPSLSLLDQRKCEHLLLALMCKKYSSVLYRKVELSSHYIDITLIRGRLLQKLSPPYRTPSEFVSDIWVLLETLSKNSEESGLVFRMQKYFQKKLSRAFGDALHPSLLKCPGAEDGVTEPDAGAETGKVRETLKRMREFIAAYRPALAKKVCKDVGTEPKEESRDSV
ncbi:transcription intermediary factor 1-beta isoform X2 [Conger conger]|uniref:transcription intermediary factor 1-beta isoform X2 n=1 Tax=Conger conger TaxID=82655 RepID=UPI002A5A0F7A|nr:transcription intermediary factor 1-beta isoform X2 [Conger conger]